MLLGLAQLRFKKTLMFQWEEEEASARELARQRASIRVPRLTREERAAIPRRAPRDAAAASSSCLSGGAAATMAYPAMGFAVGRNGNGNDSAAAGYGGGGGDGDGEARTDVFGRQITGDRQVLPPPAPRVCVSPRNVLACSAQGRAGLLFSTLCVTH